MVHFENPSALATAAHDSRNFYEKLGWGRESCQIGIFGDQVRLACDTGAIDYTFLPDGTIRRETHGGYSKLIEFVDMDIDVSVRKHNRNVPAAVEWDFTLVQ